MKCLKECRQYFNKHFFMEITNTKTQELCLRFFTIFIYLGNESEIKDLISKINNRKNRLPNGKAFVYPIKFRVNSNF